MFFIDFLDSTGQDKAVHRTKPDKAVHRAEPDTGQDTTGHDKKNCSVMVSGT
jgi:hypothetical protein